MRRLALVAVIATMGCGSQMPMATPIPQNIKDALFEFMAAVKANNLERMGQLWGTDRGPAHQFMEAEQLRMRLAVIQKYLTHAGFRIVEGPITPPGKKASLRTMRIELQRQGCNVVLPIDFVPVRAGGWLVYDVHLESAGNPAARCGAAPGTVR
jgi:hypothetical protein